MNEERIQTLRKEEYQRFLVKADEACRSMKDDLRAARFNSTGLQAVQTVISSADTLTVFHLGVRSTAQNHKIVLELLKRIPSKEVHRLRDQISSVLDVKNAVQYEPGRISENLARSVALQAERVLETTIRLTGGVP